MTVQPRLEEKRRFVVDGVKERSPGLCVLWGIVTAGLYLFYWFYATGKEMNDEGAKCPPGWLQLVPGVNLWWYWRWCKATEVYTRGYLKGWLSLLYLLIVPMSQSLGFLIQPRLRMAAPIFLVVFVLGLTCISLPILQSSLNKFRKQHLLAAFD